MRAIIEWVVDVCEITGKLAKHLLTGFSRAVWYWGLPLAIGLFWGLSWGRNIWRD